MAIEVEAKAHIHDAEVVTRALEEQHFALAGSVYKDDRYYRGGNGVEFRIRLEDGNANANANASDDARNRAVVTHKEKQIHDGMEFNVEHEFTVENLEAFESLCRRLGYERFALKRKRGHAYSRGSLLAEVVQVEGLGWFLEVECLVSQASERMSAAGAVREVLYRCGLTSDAIEPRTYLSMLGFRDTQPREVNPEEA